MRFSVGNEVAFSATKRRKNLILVARNECTLDCAVSAEGTIGFDSAQRIITPFFIGLPERRHCQLDAMKKITSAARREFSFPGPVDVHGERGDEHNKKETDEKPTALQSTKL